MSAVIDAVLSMPAWAWMLVGIVAGVALAALSPIPGDGRQGGDGSEDFR